MYQSSFSIKFWTKFEFWEPILLTISLNQGLQVNPQRQIEIQMSSLQKKLLNKRRIIAEGPLLEPYAKD